MAERDELDGLREAWESLEPPLPDAALDGPDAAERAALAWMRAAWTALEPSSALPPEALRERAVRPRAIAESHAAWPAAHRAVRLAAAAAMLAAALLWAALARRDAPPSAEVAWNGLEAEPVARGDQHSELPARTAGVPIAALTNDRMELRSGPVRLILLTPSAGSSRSDG